MSYATSMAAIESEIDRSDPRFRRSHDHVALSLLTGITSVAALLFYYHRHAILLYGDAVAHINIARRVFDSRTPGLFQLGTVWLPLPHALQIPFIVNGWLWSSGIGASVPSMLAYVVGTLGVYRLVRGSASRVAAWIAALIYALNPNLLYMQTTAMTEALYLACFVWTVVYFSEFARQASDDPPAARRSLEKCALALAAAMLVRYDAWFLAAVTAIAAIIFFWRHRNAASVLRRGVINFLLLTALVPGLWLAYNHAAYGNALEFANGPYSARAIQERSRTATMPSYPGEKSPRTAALYVLKVSRLNLGQGRAENLLFTAAFIAWVGALYFSRTFLPWTLLWAPLPFYMASIAWGSVPIYLPDWWPFSYYNVRYGLQLLPAVAVFVGLGYHFLTKFVSARVVLPVVTVLVMASYASVWMRSPICLREAEANGNVRMQFDRQLAAELKKLPTSSTLTLMMDCGAHPGAVQMAGIPFRRVLRESNPVYWEIALTQPARSADYVVAITGDDVSRAVRLFPEHLRAVATVGTPQGPRAVLYHSTPQ
ncbi:MAG TPA: glycosyltransferase family 39 protein [Candidatus Angelobacter sp.]|nr:glycosyltransferase family 39 protein [Candidatus Angelobacter sp.]